MFLCGAGELGAPFDGERQRLGDRVGQNGRIAGRRQPSGDAGAHRFRGAPAVLGEHRRPSPALPPARLKTWLAHAGRTNDVAST